MTDDLVSTPGAVPLSDIVDASMREHGEAVPTFDELHARYGQETAAQRYGRTIREARNAKGMTQRELARLSGMKQPSLAKIEHGEANVTLTTIQRIAHALGQSTITLDVA